jgi:hypothetical protein
MMDAMASVVRELRRTRRVHRLGELEWFELASRAYFAALAGGVTILWLSGLVTDEPASAAQLADVRAHGPAVVGFAVVLAVALGVRSGSDGGPIALEAADVHHLLLAPVPRRDVLVTPVVQRLRTMTLGGALVGAVAGQLAARRLPGSGPAWAASGALAGAATGAACVAVAVLVHVWRLPRWGATAIGAVLLAAQAGAVAGWWAGPGDGIGSVALWGWRQHPSDLVTVAVIAALVAVAVTQSHRLRVEPLVRRADLVSQLRFAVTMQDLRTVILLRRQLRDERPRSRPWTARRASRRRWTVWDRGWRGLARYPLARVGRMAALAVGAGLAAGVAADGTTPVLVAMAVCLHLLGLDVLEPLSQEIDHPDQGDALPRQRGWLLLRHLPAPAVAVVPFAFLAAAATIVVEPGTWAAALTLAVPITLVGVGGAVVSVVRDAPDPLAQPSAAMPPEVAGLASSIRLLVPVAVSALATLPVLAVRADPSPGTVVRSLAALSLVLAALVWWVRRHDDWRRRWNAFIAGGRQQAASPR